jgi:hypothetical protein
MISELVPVGTKRSIQEILDEDSCLSVNIVVAVCKQLADYLRLLHEGFIAIDQICEDNIYITVHKRKVITQFYKQFQLIFTIALSLFGLQNMGKSNIQTYERNRPL